MNILEMYTPYGLEDDLNWHMHEIKDLRGTDYSKVLTRKINEITGDIVVKMREPGYMDPTLWIAKIRNAIYDSAMDMFVKGIQRKKDGKEQYHDFEIIDDGIVQAVMAVLIASALGRVDWDTLSYADGPDDALYARPWDADVSHD